MLAPHALKGQKLLAQGSALGIIAIGKAPCKGKSLIKFAWYLKAFALTGRAASMRFCPLPFPSAGDRWFRACCFYALLGLQSIL